MRCHHGTALAGSGDDQDQETVRGRAMTKVLHALAVPLWFAHFARAMEGSRSLVLLFPGFPASAVAAGAGSERLLARFERLCTNGR